MDPITYSLLADKSNSNKYYSIIRELAKVVIQEASVQLQPIILDYRASSIANPKKTDDECILELLLLGTYTRRGTDIAHLNLDNLEKSLNALSQSWDYRYLAQRLLLWSAFLLNKPESTRNLYWQLLTRLIVWFKVIAEDVIGKYTANVDSYLTSKYNPDRTDAVFCGSSRLEYHINMVGAEILNHVNQQRFLATSKKVVVLPGCLRSIKDRCRAKHGKIGWECGQCSGTCQINTVTQLGIDNDFDVTFVIHQSNLAASAENLHDIGTTVGIIGVACVPSLLEGGYMLDSHGIPAQCVILDYCGCLNHWHDEGITTHMNVKRLQAILGLKGWKS